MGRERVRRRTRGTCRDDLTLNIGVRFDMDRANTIANSFIEDRNALLAQQVGGPPVYTTQSALHNFSPRIGVRVAPASSA